MVRLIFLTVVLVVFLGGEAVDVYAQTPPETKTDSKSTMTAAEIDAYLSKLARPEEEKVTPLEIGGGMTQEELQTFFDRSLFLSQPDIILIQNAIKGNVASNAAVDLISRKASKKKPVLTRRVISVAGVFYRAPDNWIVWLNGHKLMPGKLLPEIIDISVKDSSQVSLKWFDATLDKIISITLRPHQTYDIGTGILLPGAG